MGRRDPGGMAAAHGMDRMVYSLHNLIDEQAEGGSSSHILHYVDGKLYQQMQVTNQPVVFSDGPTPLVPEPEWVDWGSKDPVPDPYLFSPTSGTLAEPEEEVEVGTFSGEGNTENLPVDPPGDVSFGSTVPVDNTSTVEQINEQPTGTYVPPPDDPKRLPVDPPAGA